VTALGEADVIETWTAARHADRATLIERLTRLVLGAHPEATPWDVATRELLVIAATRGWPEVISDCPGCSTPMEAEVPVDHLVGTHDARRADAPPDDGDAPRVPDVADIVAAARLTPDEAAGELAARCGLDELDDESLAATLARWDDDHVLLAPALSVMCPTCGREADVAIDAVALAWATIDDLATAVFDDVGALARGFGWTEPEVLAVPPARRRMYRDLLEGTGVHG
jgi:hypothetical protein